MKHDVAPDAAWYVPFAQALHGICAMLYFPGAHPTHVLVVPLNCSPGLHGLILPASP